MSKGTLGLLTPSFHRAYTLADTQLAQVDFMSIDERAALTQVPVFARTFGAGDQLIRQGSSPDHLYLLAEGWACRCVTTRSGARQIPALLVPGGVCNLDNLLFERADFSVRAITSAKVLTLPRNQAMALAAEHPGVGRAFTLLALAENAILTQWAVGLGRRSALERLAHLLCELSIRVGAQESHGICFDLPLTQEMIGGILGLTAIHVNRTMRHLRAAGLIATAGRQVTILDIVELRSLAQFDPSYLNQIEKSAAAKPMKPETAAKKIAPLLVDGRDVAVTLPNRPTVATMQRALTHDDDLLLRETHHRCSNDFQLVIGLLDLQGRRASSEETRQAFSDTVTRVAILARSRNALNRERQPSLEAALQQVCEALQAHAEPRAILILMHADGEVHGLSPTQITTLALVVNELATNAIKHAFDEGTAGHIQIRIGAKAGGDLSIFVNDDGRPFSDVTPSAGSRLGLGLAKRLMASVGGLFIPPPPGSKTFELRVPLSRD